MSERSSKRRPCSPLAAEVASDERLVTLECVIQESDIIILGAPHKSYRSLEVGGKDVVDVWGALGEGIRL